MIGSFFFFTLLLFISTSAFNLKKNSKNVRGSTQLKKTFLFTHTPISEFEKSPYEKRKEELNGGAKVFVAALSAFSALTFLKVESSAASSETTSKTIAVLGAGGKTGNLIVEQLLDQYKSSIKVIPSYRASPKQKFDGIDQLIGIDVTKIETIESAIKGSDVVIFASSASRSGGSAEAVDYLGVENVAKECVRLKIPKLVVISSGAITRPDSLGFKITNLFGNIMNYKLKGELALKKIYSDEEAKQLSYIIIRPGGLVDGDKKFSGANKIELNQGDTISGEIKRADVAAVTIAAAISSTIPKDVTLEVYEAGSGGPLEGKFSKKSGYERNGDNFDDLFKELKSGAVEI